MADDPVQPADDAADQTRESDPKAKRPPRRFLGVSLGAYTVLAVGIGAVCLVTFYAAELKGVWALKPWSKSAWHGVLDDFSSAIEAGDTSRLDSLGVDGGFACDVRDGKIVALKPATEGMMPMAPVDKVLPASGAEPSTKRYKYRQCELHVQLPATDGSSVLYVLMVVNGDWKVQTFRPSF